MAMNHLHKLMYWGFPPFIFICMCFSLPPYLLFKFIHSILTMFSTEDMTGKIVLVTGASSGIGEQLVYEYARRGARLVLVARRKNRLEEVAEKARSLGSKDVLVVCGDVSKVEDCKKFIEETINHFGRLDHLVNNAGITSICPFEEVTNILNFKHIMDVNFWGSIYATHFAIPHLKESKGRIIAISSPSGSLQSPRLGLYGASKAALNNFYESLRVELDPEISITIVAPGLVDSEMTQGKFLGQEGEMQVDNENMSLLIGTFPVISADTCAKAIVNGVCRGEWLITEPWFYRILYIWKAICPEIAHYLSRTVFSFKPYNTRNLKRNY